MRNPERIESIIACLRGIWYQVPDWRFGQLLSNLLHAMYEEGNGLDPFFMEDDRFVDLVNRICKRLGVEKVRETVELWEERCRGCDYCFEDYDGEWHCAHQWEEACKNIKECVVKE